MRINAILIFLLTMLLPLTAKNNLYRPKRTWKSRNRRQHARTLDRDHIYYLPRTYKDEVAFNHSKSLSFEEVVRQLKEIGILDLPNVSVIRMENSTQSQDNASSAVEQLEKRRCNNPCGGCSTQRTEKWYNVQEVAMIKVRTVECTVAICFNGQGECQKIKRNYELFGRHPGGTWQSKTIEVDVDCACAQST